MLENFAGVAESQWVGVGALIAKHFGQKYANPLALFLED
jgi:hypothetical protein